MIKKEIYPKIERISVLGEKVYVTEKLDGSNLVIFKKMNKLYLAQRKTIVSVDELERDRYLLYKGLYDWFIDNKFMLYTRLVEGRAICGDWLGMGEVKYSTSDFDKKFYMFSTAHIDEDFNLYDIVYEHDKFIYSFIDKKVPSFIGIVPVIKELNVLPNKEYLDSIYKKYVMRVNRDVKGFIISYKNIITKYVRMENGKLVEHFE